MIGFSLKGAAIAKIPIAPGQAVFCPRKEWHNIRWDEEISVLSVRMPDSAFMEAARERLTDRSLEIVPKHVVTDDRLTHLLFALDAERARGYSAGTLFVDCIESALANILSKMMPQRGISVDHSKGPALSRPRVHFVPFGEEEYPVGTTPAMYAHLATLKGEDVVRYSFQEMHPQRTRITLEPLPGKVVHTGVKAIVLDTIHFFAELVPMNMLFVRSRVPGQQI